MKKQNNKVEINGNGFCLRLATLKDTASLVENGNNTKIAKNMFDGFPSPLTKEKIITFIKKTWRDKKKNGYISDFAIIIDNKAVGMVGFSVDKKLIASMGYWIGKKYWGKGIGTKVVKEITNYLFENIKVVRIQANVYFWNIGSKRVLEKNNYICEGLFKKYFVKNNKAIDTYQFAKIK